MYEAKEWGKKGKNRRSKETRNTSFNNIIMVATVYSLDDDDDDYKLYIETNILVYTLTPIMFVPFHRHLSHSQLDVK